MGKKWSRKRKTEEAKVKLDRQAKKGRRDRDYGTWQPNLEGNAKMEAYYALQGCHNLTYSPEKQAFVSCTTDEQKEQERIQWLSTLQSILPASFRIGTDVDQSHRQQMECELEAFVGTEMEISIDPIAGRRGGSSQLEKQLITKKIAPAMRIPFIPHAYQLSLDRRTIRRNPALEPFHKWLATHTSAGFITRQETVSMIPPIVLSVEPHHSVLDMCAAPGSKTSQMLETVSMPTVPTDLEPRGCVVANDGDPKRAYMLVHQLRRINSPTVLVTSCDARFFPLLKTDGDEGMFDRVLCDVPCSGDGTTRKNPGVWKHWTALAALNLHPLQLGIALNGARLTKVGGYICYSTCSMNPIENEAVVAELLRAADGSLELVDKRLDMSGLLARPGWSSWKVMREDQSRREMKNSQKKNSAKMQARRKAWAQKNGDAASDDAKANGTGNGVASLNNDEKECDNGKAETNDYDKRGNSIGGPPPSWDEATLLERARAEGLTEYKSCDEVPDQWKRMVRRTCFPPTEEEATKFHLEKCIRCLPHDMDTGGFFIALLKKVAPMSKSAIQEALSLAKEFRPDAVDDAGYTKSEGKTDDAQVASETDETELEVIATLENGAGEGTPGKDSQRGETVDVDNTDQVSEKDGKPTKTVKGKPLLRGRGKTRGNEGNDDFVPLDEKVWAPLVDFYGLSDKFPRDQYMIRACSEAKVIYFIGAPIKKLIDCGIQDRVTIINSGLKSFARNTKDCEVAYRIAQEGIHYLAPHMTKRKVSASVDDFSKCIQLGTINLEKFSDEFAETVRVLEPGSFAVALKGYELDFFQKMFLVMWRCRKDAVDCLVGKVEMDGMKSKLRAVRENGKEAPSETEGS